MPIARVQLPDGRIGRFEVPDGTTPDQVTAFINTQQIPAQQAPEQTFGQTAAQLGKAALAGTAQLPLGAGQLATAGLRKVFPESETLEDLQFALARSTGRTQGAIREAKEESPILGTIAELAPQIGQLLPVGAGVQTLKGLVGAGAAGGAIASGLAPTGEVLTPDQQIAQQAKQAAIGGTVGAALGPAVKLGVASAKALPALPGRIASKLANINPEALEFFESAGVKQSLGAVSNSPSIKLFDKFLSKFPGAAGVLQKNTDEVLSTIEKTVANAGGAKGVSVQEAGEVIQRGGRNFVKRFQGASEFLYNKVDKKIAGDKLIKVDNIRPLLDDVQFTDDVFGKEAAAIASSINKAASTAKGGITGVIPGEVGTIPYSQLRKFRTLVGNKLSKSFLIGGEDEAALKRLYGSLTADLKVAAKDAGAIKEFDRANAFFSKNIEQIENQLQKVIQKDAPEQVFQAAISGTKLGGTKINQIMRSLKPSERDIVRGTIVNRLGKASAGQQGAAGETFSSSAFLTNWNKLAPEAKQALYGSNTATRKSLDNVANIAERIKGIDRFGNPSGTAQQVTLGALIVGGALEPLSVAGGVTGANISARLMTSDKFVQWLSKHAQKRLTQPTLKQAITDLNKVSRADPLLADDIARYVSILGGLSQQ